MISLIIKTLAFGINTIYLYTTVHDHPWIGNLLIRLAISSAEIMPESHHLGNYYMFHNLSRYMTGTLEREAVSLLLGSSKPSKMGMGNCCARSVEIVWDNINLVGGLVAIFYFPIFGNNHPN